MRTRASKKAPSCGALLVLAALATFGGQPALGSWLSDEAGLPACQRSGEYRVPIAVWFGSIWNTSEPDTPAPPPMRGGTVIYLQLTINPALLDDFATPCSMSAQERTFTLKFPNDAKQPEAGGLRIHLRGETGFAHGACTVSGFYTSTAASNIREGWSDIWLRDSEGSIALYPRYCIADPKLRLRPAKPKVLPTCEGASDDRTPVPVWRPQLTARGELSSAPPQGDGMIVSIAIDTKRNTNGVCAGWDHGHFSFLLPKGANAAAPTGLLVTLLGNEMVLPGKCLLSGYYMNEPKFDQSGGLSRTYFSSVDAGRLIASGQFCQAPGIVPGSGGRIPGDVGRIRQ